MRKVRVWDPPNPEKWFQGDITQGGSRPELSIGSQGQGLSESPPSLHLHARIDQMYVTWRGHLPREEDSTVEADSKGQTGLCEQRRLRPCGAERPLRAGHQTQEATVCPAHTSPQTGRQTLGPRKPHAGHLPSLSRGTSARSTLTPPPRAAGPEAPAAGALAVCGSCAAHESQRELKSGRVLSHNVVVCSTERFRKCPRLSL